MRLRNLVFALIGFATLATSACSGDSVTGVTTTTTTTEADLYVRVMTVSVVSDNKSPMYMTFDTAAVATSIYTNQQFVGSQPRSMILRKGQKANIGLSINAPGWYTSSDGTKQVGYEVLSTWHPVAAETHSGIATDGTSRFLFRTFADTLPSSNSPIITGGFTGTISDYKFGTTSIGGVYFTTPSVVLNYVHPDQLRTTSCDADDQLVYKGEDMQLHVIDKAYDFFYPLGNAPVTTVTCKLYANISAARAANPDLVANDLR